MEKSAKTILIIDDNLGSSNSLRIGCQSVGMTVIAATTVIEAATQLDIELPDLICINANTSPGNALELCEALAEDDAGSKIPIIVVTDRKDEHTIKKCGDLCAYYVQNAGDLWKRIEPIVYELVDIEPKHNVPKPPSGPTNQGVREDQP